MEKDEKHYDFAYEVAIGSVLWNIERKEELSKDGKFRVDCIKEYFQEINKTIDSMSNKEYVFTPHFKEVILAIADKKEKDISLEHLIKYKEEFNLMNTKLENLKTNPQEFYNSEDSQYISNIMNKIKPIFETPHVPFMTCCGENMGSYD